MAYYLDANAIISLGELPQATQRLADLHASGTIKLLLAREAVYELIEGPKVTAENKTKNQRILDKLGLSISPDSIFLLGKGILDETTLGADQSHEIYESHLRNKGNPSKAVSDGVHLANARALNAVFVSCDYQARSTARDRGLDKECLIDFLSRLEIDTSAINRCKKCLRLGF
jgi:hypothetical protein